MNQDVSAEFLALQQLLAGRYSIESELGRGGMGVVLLARDVALDRLVAIKLLPADLAANPDYRERFLHEARTAAGLSHPNIVPIHSVEEHGDLVFFVMGYVDGETLRERVERAGPMPPRLALKVMQEVAWALGYAHQRDVVHRDVKPDNIMIESGTERALVTDFGIAVASRDTEKHDGLVVGTARYMSPEQACGEPVDGRSDLYSLGATFFYTLTGRAPFEGATAPALMAQHVSQPPPALQLYRPEVSGKLAAVVTRCLQKRPADRYPSGDELARVVGDLRGQDRRAPPLVRSFVRNAQVTTMVLLAVMLAGQGITIGDSGAASVSIGFGFIGPLLIFQLIVVARRLLREGYTFHDIRAALLAEAEVQEEEADELKQRRWLRRLDTLWHRLWAGGFGRWFFDVSGLFLKRPARLARPSVDATEMVLGRSALQAYEDLPDQTRRQMGAVPRVVERLEERAEALRADGETGVPLLETVAALENLRVAMLRFRVGSGSVQDLTAYLEKARAIGEQVDRRVSAGREVAAALAGPPLRGPIGD